MAKVKAEANGVEVGATRRASVGVVIKEPNIRTLRVRLIGTAPYVQCKFGEKARGAMMAKMAAGSQAKKGKAREARDFDADYRGAMHRCEAPGGGEWCGIPAGAFRAACISACRTVGFKMTLAKLSLFVVQDGVDAGDGTPLVRIHGEPVRIDMPVRNATGVWDVRVRPQWREWHVDLTVRYDADQFSDADVLNLLARAGEQVGVGEGRPDSRNSAGLGWGTFRIATADDMTD